MGIFDGCPWRQVVYIEDASPGPRGGGAWWLTLECGHFAVRAKPSSRPDLGVDAKGRGVFSVPTVLRRARRGVAPSRVRCLMCARETALPKLAGGTRHGETG